MNITSFGEKRVFADVFKLRVLRYNHPRSFGWALNPTQRPYKSQGDYSQKKGNVTMETETG